MYSCTYVCMYVFMYVCMYVCMADGKGMGSMLPSALLGGDDVRNLSAREELRFLFPCSRDIKLVTYIHSYKCMYCMITTHVYLTYIHTYIRSEFLRSHGFHMAAELSQRSN